MMTKKLIIIVFALIAFSAFFQILANNNKEIMTPLTRIKGDVLSDPDSNYNVNIHYDTTWAGGAGIKSVHISRSGKIAVACDLEGCSVWVLDLITNKVAFKILFDQITYCKFKINHLVLISTCHIELDDVYC
jgi:hypothetical protein